MDEENYELSWEDATAVVEEQAEVISEMNQVSVQEIIEAAEEEYAEGDVVEEEVQAHEIDDENGGAAVLSDETISTVEETPPLSGPEENTMYITDDSDVAEVQPDTLTQEELMEVTTEEVITEYPQELVIGSEEAVGGGEEASEEVVIPLAADQDEYTAARPYPCDFCSRRFRKKANLMNHMVAHQTDRPHGCNLCGVRYIRKSDLMNHLKTHAYIADGEDMDDEVTFIENEFGGKKKPRTFVRRKKKKNYELYESTGETEASGSQSFSYSDNVIEEIEDSEHYYGTNNDEEEVQEIKYPATDPKKPFVCQHCGVSFAREKALQSHSRIHGGDSPFECQKCGELFWDVDKVKQHVRDKHGEEVDFDLEDDDDYSESDDVVKYGTYYCATCGLSFHRFPFKDGNKCGLQDNLRRHQRIHIKEEYLNEQEVGHICNVCGESFPEALDLLAHAEVHARGSEFRCMVCGEICVDENILAAHVQALHAKTLGENSCLMCGRSCKDSKTLMKHSWEHSKEKTFACSKCSKTFHNKARLKRHMLSHRNKVVACEECGEEFPDGRSLMNHRHSHSSVSGRQFPCRECGKTFGSRSSQQIHIRIHTGERPYGCRFCWKAFADGGTLRKHERIHTGEKPYACAVCPRAFNQRVVLREHIRSHHSGPDPKYTHSMTPYCCAVCSDMFATSQDLILHLIHHCDLNTAMKRQPQVGPRKYKRRRKLKPHELELISGRQETHHDADDAEYDDNDNEQFETEGFHYEATEEQPIDQEVEAPEPQMSPPRRLRRSSRRISTSSAKGGDISDSYEQMLEGLTASAQQQAPQSPARDIQQQQPHQQMELPVPATRGRGRPPKNRSPAGASPPARPKMIHTSKTKLGSVAVEKTKGMRTQSTGERRGARTKNVSHFYPAPLPAAIFPDPEPQQAVENLLKQTEIEQQQALEQEQFEKERILCENPTENQQIVENADDPDLLETTLEEVVTGQAAQADRPEPTNIIRVMTKPRISTRSVTKANNSTQMIGGQKVRIVKSGMLITKKRNSESVSESESIPPQTQENLPEATEGESSNQIFIKQEALQIDESPIRVKSEQIDLKQELMDPSPLHELAEISMRHGTTDGFFRCEMCDAAFADKNQLLLHVPIHI